jgi:kumamolisin
LAEWHLEDMKYDISSAQVPIPGSTRPPLAKAKLVARSDQDKRIRVSIYARRNPEHVFEAASIADELGSQLPAKRKYLTPKEFETIYGAQPAELRKIADWVKQNGLKIVHSSAPHRRVIVEGRIADIEKTFSLQLNEYDDPKAGRFRGRVGDVHVPPDLASIVQGVFGLDTRPVGRSRLRRSPAASLAWETEPAKLKTNHRKATGRADLRNKFPGAFLPPQVADLYGYPADFDGSGQNIAVFAFNGGDSPDPRGGYKLSSLKTYFEQVLGGKTPPISDVVIQGPGNDPGPDTKASQERGDATGEVMLDLCVVGSVAPGAKIFVYFTEFTTRGWIDALNDAIAGDNNISVISISYGNPEDDPQGAWTAMGVKQVNEVFQAAAAKGVTICVASGDDGSRDQEQSGVHVDFPASSPYVLAVGGTKLVASQGEHSSITQEIVWNETMIEAGAGGGGVSIVFTKPLYQSGAGVPPAADPPHTIGRGLPDVAAVADPLTGVVVMHVSGTKLEPIGGTSGAAPLWAALIARINQGLGVPCGFLNPVLYQKFASGVLRDITLGNNGNYEAKAGWDACTGLGAPGGDELLKALLDRSISREEKSRPKRGSQRIGERTLIPFTSRRANVNRR